MRTMRRIAWRTTTLALLVLCVLSVVFFVAHLVPGDPVGRIQDQDLGEAQRALLRHRLGLDEPLGRRYLHWLAGAVRGDLGTSLRQQRPVTAILAEALPRTLLLTVTAYLVHLLLALPLGVWLARHYGTRRERLVDLAGLVAWSLPSFWLGLILILLFARGLGWLPSGGMTSLDAARLGWPAQLGDLARHMVLPVVVLGASTAAGTARYLRNSLLEVLDADFIVAARARGLPERTVVWRHAVRNALLPVVTLVGLNLPFLLGGAVVTETVFAWPGMGRVTVEAIFARDYPVVIGATALAGVLVVVGNALADALYAVVDPRVGRGSGGGP